MGVQSAAGRLSAWAENLLETHSRNRAIGRRPPLLFAVSRHGREHRHNAPLKATSAAADGIGDERDARDRLAFDREADGLALLRWSRLHRGIAVVIVSMVVGRVVRRYYRLCSLALLEKREKQKNS